MKKIYFISILFLAPFYVLSSPIDSLSALIYQQVRHSVDQNADKKNPDYLITSENSSTELLSEKWVNGGLNFMGATAADYRTKLRGILNNFNQNATSLPLYAYTGRYFMDYPRLGREYDMAAQQSVIDKIETQLKNGITLNAPAPLNVSANAFDSKKFVTYLDEHYDAIKLEQRSFMILFNIETIYVEPTLENGVRVPKYTLQSYTFIWSYGANEEDKERIKALKPILVKGIELPEMPGYQFKPLVTTTNSNDDAERRYHFEYCLRSVKRLWGEEGDSFADPYGFNVLVKNKNTPANLPIWAQGLEPAAFEKIRDGFMKRYTAGQQSIFGGYYYNPSEEAQRAERQRCEAATIILLQEAWVHEQFSGTITIPNGPTYTNLNQLIPLWGSGKRLYLYSSMAENATVGRWNITDQIFTNSMMFIFDGLTEFGNLGRVTTFVTRFKVPANFASRFTLQRIRDVVNKQITYRALIILVATTSEIGTTSWARNGTRVLVKTEASIAKIAQEGSEFLASNSYTKGATTRYALTEAELVSVIDAAATGTVVQNAKMVSTTFTKTGSEIVHQIQIIDEFGNILAYNIVTADLGANLTNGLPPLSNTEEATTDCTFCRSTANANANANVQKIVTQEACRAMLAVCNKAGRTTANETTMGIICREPEATDDIIKDMMRILLSTDWSASKVSAFLIDMQNNRSLRLGIYDELALINVWKNILSTSIVKSDVEFLKYAKELKDITAGQGKNLHHHIFIGKTGGTNGISGVHHINALTTRSSGFVRGDIRIKSGTKMPKPHNFWEAEIEYFDGVNWLPKLENGLAIRNGFYPDSWSVEVLMEEIAFARSKITPRDWIPPIPPKTSSNTFLSTLSNGQEVWFYIGRATSSAPTSVGIYIITVFPKL